MIAKATLGFSGAPSVTVSVFKDNSDGNLYYAYTYTGGAEDAHIRPTKQIVEDYFRNCDDFTAVLLNRDPKPIYTAVFETPRETETGIYYDMVSYTWPSINGGFNPDLTGPYYSYLGALINLGEFYDEYFTDNMWRSLTHEAIKTLDWTYVSNNDGDIQDMSTIDTSRVEPITKIYGRQFDDLKRYADGIKSTNTITYDQKSNAPDYVMTDILENSGWEVNTLRMTGDKSIATESLYSGLTFGYTESDANIEFMRRLKLNSTYLHSVKGTRKGIDAMMSLFGFTPDDYDVHEYVCVFRGQSTGYTHFCDRTEGINFSYPLAEDVATINKYKINFNPNDPYGDYCGIPVTEVGYVPENPVEGKNYSYVIPWYSNGKTYDDGLYFQMHGGWGKRAKMDVNLEIASAITEIIGTDELPLYMETQARLKFAKDFDELIQEAGSSSNLHDVFYVTDISNIGTEYASGSSEDLSGASHYFVLENVEYSQYLGKVSGSSEYGWRSIAMSEIQQPNTAGTLVIYLESIKDDTTGNNPHIGNGTYDDGMAYVSGMSDIFTYSLVNQNFIGINDKTCKDIKGYKFDVTTYEDNRKCWYFTDNFNVSSGKSICNEDGSAGEGAEIYTFKEGDVTIDRCDTTISYDDPDKMTEENEIKPFGSDADSHFSPDTPSGYYRTSNLVGFNPEEGQDANTGEAAANSIVNIKNLLINFNVSNITANETYKKMLRQYIERSVLPYLTQMIPSTSILKWTFDGS